MEGLERILSEHPFFATFPQEHRQLLAGCAKNHRFNAGQFLFHEGDPANEFFLIRHGKIALEIVDTKTSSLWNAYIDRYHYLGYTPLPGAQLRYFVKADGEILALLGFGAAAWKCAPRDTFIGWDAEARKRNLHLVVNNARFLILVQVKNLASRILSLAAKRIGSDWHARYGYAPVLLETFVDTERFTGTCYKASNWVCVGATQGRGKLDRYHEQKLPVKSVWLYPLDKDFRQCLTG